MPKRFTERAADCAHCQMPLPVPRPIRRVVHSECVRAYDRAQARVRYKVYVTDPGFIKSESDRSREKQRKLRRDTLEAYGGKCECCGIDTYEWLTIDHIDGNGADHRREIGRAALYRWLKREGYPTGFRVLCWNCNCARGYYGHCPHEDQ